MEQRKFIITRTSPVKPLFAEVCENIHGHTVYRRRYQSNVFVFHHTYSSRYYTIQYMGSEPFAYERLIEYIIGLRPQLNTKLN
ncbi:MAG TPA: hypothetical protein VF581_11490 [Flavobacterium sp.]